MQIDESIESHTIVLEAKKEVRQKILQAKEDNNKLIEKASKLAMSEGYSKAEKIITKINNLNKLMEEEEQDEIIRMSIEIAKRILLKEYANPKKYLLNLSRVVLESVKDSEEVHIRVNVKDSLFLKEVQHRLLDVLERAKEITIKEDKQVEAGGIVIQTDSGIVDAQISTQIEEISRILIG